MGQLPGQRPLCPLEAGSRGPLFPQEGCLEQPQPWRLALLPEQCPHEASENISCAQGPGAPAFMCLVLPGRDIMGAQEASVPASPCSQVDNSGLTLPVNVLCPDRTEVASAGPKTGRFGGPEWGRVSGVGLWRGAGTRHPAPLWGSGPCVCTPALAGLLFHHRLFLSFLGGAF